LNLKDGRTLTRQIAQRRRQPGKADERCGAGSQISTTLAEGILPKDQSRRIMDMCWSIEKAPDAGSLAEASQA